jgi:endonuclease/exonuclease/phosphatase family metal-dependent hydrolase
MANSNTVMGRDMLVTTCTFNSKPLTLVNTHLESGGEAAQQRVIQLNTALETLTTAQSGTATTKKAVILAGDLNLREKETKEVTRLKAVHDAWEITLGASNDREHKYTWDMQLNTNYEMQAAYKVCSACTHAATAYLTRLQRISSA